MKRNYDEESKNNKDRKYAYNFDYLYYRNIYKNVSW